MKAATCSGGCGLAGRPWPLSPGCKAAPTPRPGPPPRSRRGRPLIAATSDPLRRQRLEWELGLALADASQADQAAQQFDRALATARQASDYLDSGGKDRQPSPEESYILAQLYYRAGVSSRYKRTTTSQPPAGISVRCR